LNPSYFYGEEDDSQSIGEKKFLFCSFGNANGFTLGKAIFCPRSAIGVQFCSSVTGVFSARHISIKITER